MESLQIVVLALTGALNIGNSYCYDNPSALKSQLQEHFHQMPAHEYEMAFNLLYTVYSIPNIILPFFGGYLTDRFGPRKVLFAMTLFITTGQLIVAWGSQCNSFLMMLFGRIVFGLGGETISVAQATLLAMWFPSYELAFANGVLLCISKLAATLNNEMSPFLAETFGLVNALWAGAVLCALSLLATIILSQIDAKAEQHIDYDVLSQDEREREHQFKEHIQPSDAAQFSMSFWLIAILYFTIYAIVGPFNNVASSVFMERDFYKTLPEDCSRCGTGFYASDPNCSLPNSNCPTSPPFEHPLPQLSSSCLDQLTSGKDQITCSTTPPYISSQDINCDKKEWKSGTLTKAYCAAKYEAEQAAAIPLGTASFVIAISAPICGYLVDHFGCRAIIAVASMILSFLSQLLIGYSSLSLYIPVIIQALALSCFSAAMLPALTCCVEPHHIGTAYGITAAFANVGMAVVPMFVVVEYTWFHKYLPYLTLIFMTIAFYGILCAAALTYIDFTQHNGHLHAVKMTSMPSDATVAEPLNEIERQDLLQLAHKHYGTQIAS